MGGGRVFCPEDFDLTDGVAIECGKASGDRVCVDHDDKRSVTASRWLLSITAMEGRAEPPGLALVVSRHQREVSVLQTLEAHRHQSTHRPPKEEEPVILELRATGQYAVIPPSGHPSGEQRRWSSQTMLDIAFDVLRRDMTHAAIAVLLAEHFPGAGSRHNPRLALAGYLKSRGLKDMVIRQIGHAIMDLLQSDHKDWEEACRTTFDKPTDAHLTGGPTLANQLNRGPEVLARIDKWLGHKVQKPSRRLPEFITEEELITRVAAKWIVQHLIPEASFVQIVGHPGAFKTSLAVDLMMAVAGGRPTFLGKRVNVHGPVAYVIAEGIGRFKFRPAAWRQEFGVTAPLPIRFADGAFDLRDSLAVEDLIAKLQCFHPIVVVFDTQNRSTPGANENASEDAGAMIAACDAIREAIPGATVVLLHHPRKAGDSDRGHTSVKGALDGQFWMEVTDKLLGLIKFRVEKLKDADDTFEVALKRKVVELADIDPNTGKPETGCVLLLADAKDLSRSDDVLKRKILEFVKANPSCNKTAVRKGVNAHKNEVSRLIDALILEQRLAAQKQGKSTLLTFVSYSVSAGMAAF